VVVIALGFLGSLPQPSEAKDCSKPFNNGWEDTSRMMNSAGSNLLANLISTTIAPTAGPTSTTAEAGSATSGTSGCSDTPASNTVRQQTEMLFTVMGPAIHQQIAQGQGQALIALSEVLGCAAQDRPLLFQTMQAQFADLVPSPTVGASEIVTNLKLRLTVDGNWMQRCGNLRYL
jgi:hypothetical protein